MKASMCIELMIDQTSLCEYFLLTVGMLLPLEI
jgi:hypothetical protein